MTDYLFASHFVLPAHSLVFPLHPPVTLRWYKVWEARLSGAQLCNLFNTSSMNILDTRDRLFNNKFAAHLLFFLDLSHTSV